MSVVIVCFRSYFSIGAILNSCTEAYEAGSDGSR